MRFTGQLAGWVLPEPASTNLQTTLSMQGNAVVLDVDALDDAGRPWNFVDVQATVIGPDLVSRRVTLSQTAPGHYAAKAPANAEGTYLVQIVAGQAGAAAGRDAVSVPGAAAATTTGFVVPYSPEYKRGAATAGQALLRDLAQGTGGRQVAAAGEAWARTGPPAHAAQPASTPLLLLAALLFPLDVAVRRLRLSRRDWGELWRRLGAGLKARRPRRRPVPARRGTGK